MKINKDTVFHIPAGSGIGDALQYSRHGEFFQREYGCKMKLNYIDRWQLYANNYYVELVEDDWDVNLWGLNLPMTWGSPIYQNLSKLFDLDLWHDDIKPSMYLDTKVPFPAPTIGIHVEGAMTHGEPGHCREIPQPIAQMLADSLYEKFIIAQFGGKNDYTVEGAVDYRGLSIPETHERIASCELIIGVNSGMLHVAACTDTPIFIYTNVGVQDDPWNNPKAPTHDWFYRSLKYIGPKGKQNVIPIIEFIEGVQNDH